MTMFLSLSLVCVYVPIAPWPLRNPHKAHKHFLDALKVAPHSCRTNYMCGVSSFILKRYSEAQGFFMRGGSPTTTSATTQSERDCEVFLRDECKRALTMCRRKGVAA